MQLKAGTTLQNGKYKIIRVLGQGGFGITYLAENTLLEKNVAIKEFFPKDFCGRDNTSHLTIGTENNADTVAKLKARFLKEAKNIARLDHPGIVKIHDVFEEKNTAYYVMDYIEGENLNDMVKRNGSLPEQKAIEYIIKVGEALEYIHSQQMTHFDVKPANIVVRCNDDQPILIDFGLSKQYDNNGDATSTLMQGVSYGYSPIELYNPGSISSFSPQTDIYSLGATFYYLLTASVPPSASDLLEVGLTIPSTISNANASAIRNAMTLSKGERQKSINAFIEELYNLRHNYKSNSNNINIKKIKKKTGLTIIFIGIIIGLSIAIYAYLQISNNFDNKITIDNVIDYSKDYFTNNLEAKIGDYVYEDNTISHKKLNDKRIIGRIITTGYHPSVFSFIPIANCTKNEIDDYVSSFSTTHKNVRIPSQDDWAEFMKTMYNISTTTRLFPCYGRGYGSTMHKVNMYQYTSPKATAITCIYNDGWQLRDAWCSENEEREYLEGKIKHRLIWDMAIGCKKCSCYDDERANLIVIYNL